MVERDTEFDLYKMGILFWGSSIRVDDLGWG